MKARNYLASFLFCVAALALAVEKVSVPELVKNGSKYDNKEVQVTASFVGFQQKTSRAGNKYYTFRLKDGEAVVNGYGRGTLENPPKDGSKARVTGVYRTEKKVGTLTFKNEIDCTPVEGKEFGVKSVE